LIRSVGPALVRTVRHFFPDLPAWLNGLPDTRHQPMVVYPTAFLFWWGLSAFLFKLGSRRQLDYELRDLHTDVLSNLNRLAGAAVETLPVHQTLDHFVHHVGSSPFADLRTQMMRRLIRMKTLEDARLAGAYVVCFDGTGMLTFRDRHCPFCLTAKQGNTTLYFHTVLEAKLVTPSGLCLSMGTEFLENAPQVSAVPDTETCRQDCELKAFERLAESLKRDFPQTPICLAGDSLYACGPVLTIAEEQGWSYVLTFKEGRMPDVWKEFQALLHLVPENTLSMKLVDGTEQLYRWVNDLSYKDDRGRSHVFSAFSCQEKQRDGTTRFFAWITDHRVSSHNVAELATKGGRIRSAIENEGFNMQKNSGLNLEHAYSKNWEREKAYYYLLQIGHLILQLLEKGGLLEQMARSAKKTVVQLFGSLKNVARRLLDSFRFSVIPDEAFDPLKAAGIRVRLDTS